MENPSGIEVTGSKTARTPQGSEADSLAQLGELIERAQAGDVAALNGLMAWARPRLLAVAMRTIRDRDDAEDVAQEALLKVCRYLTRFEGRAAFGTWIHRITVNTGLDWLRRQQARHEQPAERGGRDDDQVGAAVPLDPIDEETPERAYRRAEAGAAVQRAIARLPQAQAETLSLREIDGESYQDIAAIVRCPVGTVMSRLFHARRRLAAELGAADEARAAA